MLIIDDGEHDDDFDYLDDKSDDKVDDKVDDNVDDNHDYHAHQLQMTRVDRAPHQNRA